MDGKCDKCRVKMREDDEKRRLLNRLLRIEGQVRGVRTMVENDVYCTDVITQVSAVISALSSFSRELLSEHIKTCVASEIKSGSSESVEELVDLVGKMLR